MNDAAKYIRRARQCLPGSRRQTAWITEQIHISVDGNLSELSYAEIVDRLGTPESLAAEQIEAMPAAEIAEKVRLQNWVKKIIVAVAAVIIILFTGIVVAEYIDARNVARGNLEREEIIIDYQSDNNLK